MKIRNIQYTQVKIKNYEILLPKNMKHIKVGEWGRMGDTIAQFTYQCEGVLERYLGDENPCFEEVELAMMVTFWNEKLYVDQRYKMFKTKQDERKFSEFLIHRKDIIEAAKEYEFLYERLKEKPRVDGYAERRYVKDEQQEEMKEVAAFVKYKEEGEIK
ncbi:TPA: hypothetical protein QCU60_004322 [Bacillus cereus]|nr:hypothetical protein [Bacillus cereus]HDR6312336.1 hypothetical protein [Bacillus cereus]